MTVVEIEAGTWRLESLFGTRFMYQYVVADGDEVVIVDTGDATTPRDVIMPGLRSLGIAREQVTLVLVTHPDLDHQGGLAGLREQLPHAIAACGFADRMMVREPERLVTDRYGAYQAEHGLGYGAAGETWMRANYGAPAPVEVGLAGGEALTIGERRLVVRHAPGHSAGHLIAHEPATGLLLTSDAVHGSMCPAADGSPALPPTYEDVAHYLETIAMIETLDAREMHSGHWPVRSGPEINAFLRESREFVERMDDALLERLETHATLEQLCVHADQRLGPFGADPVNLMFAVHGHVQLLLRTGRAAIIRAGERPPRYQRP
jgi:glyoxylase-like metal-dependent hydrolase (beta-lactamase superfamily II)